MTQSPPAIPLARIVPIVLAVMVGIVLGMAFRGGPGDADRTTGTATEDAWTCSMHPQIQETQPGPCPLCGMDLIPATGTTDAPQGAVVLSERARTMSRLRTTTVDYLAEEGSLLRLLGRLEPAETERRSVTAWVGGRVDRLVVTTTGEPVQKGQVIANLYSPEVYAAHQDLLTARDQLARLSTGSETARAAASAALDAARDRLRLLGVPGSELTRLEAADAPTETVAIRTPHTGTVLSRAVTQGEYVQTGSTLFEVARLDPLWVQLDAYEQDLTRLSVGQAVQLDVEALPGESFEGRVAFVDPTLDAVRRTARVRVEVANPDGRLRPGFFAEAVVETAIPASDAPLVIPTSAALYTGRRSVVYVEERSPAGLAYRPRTVRLGPRIGDVYPVLSGLQKGERVVSRGAFVLDADLQLRGGASMMTRPDDLERESNGPIALSTDDRRALKPVFDAYLALQTALAADDLPAAQLAAGVLGSAASTAQLPDEAASVWEPLAQSLRTDANLVARAETIALARSAFAGLSDVVQTLLSRFGNPLDNAVHVAFCPMAFDNQGGTWIQVGTTIDNAYYGAAMRTCGELQTTVQPGQHIEPDADVRSPG